MVMAGAQLAAAAGGRAAGAGLNGRVPLALQEACEGWQGAGCGEREAVGRIRVLRRGGT